MNTIVRKLAWMSLLSCVTSLSAMEGVELWPAAPESSLSFGSAVAIDGDMAVVGATGYDTNGLLSAGAAYVFFRSASGWVEQARLVASDPGAIDLFGRAVDIDGALAVVGAENHDKPVEYAGAVYVFAPKLRCEPPPVQICRTLWSQRAKLVGENEQDHFGHAVALSGTTLVVGTPFHDGDGPESGLVYVFVLDQDGVWQKQATLRPSDAAGSAYFGRSVSIDGDVVAVGSNLNGAYVFRRHGASWTQEAKLTADDVTEPNGIGQSAAVDGERVVVGAPSDDDRGAVAGAVYVFESKRKCVGLVCKRAWTRRAKLTASDGLPVDELGWSVAVDGGTIVAGAPAADDLGSVSGKAYAFELRGQAWVQTEALLAVGGAASERFGEVVAVSEGMALLGNQRHSDPDIGDHSGAAYSYRLSEPPFFADGFESGDVSGWSSAVR